MDNFIKNDKQASSYQLTIMSVLCAMLIILPVLIIILAYKTEAFAVLLYIISGVFIMLIITFTIVNAIVSSKIYAYKIDENGLEIIKGFIFIKHTFLPKNKICSIKIINKKYIYKNLCNIVFINDANNVILKNISLINADKLLKENFKGVYYNESI
jgi:membrane protein YdbS with pleckstrin-like domain